MNLKRFAVPLGSLIAAEEAGQPALFVRLGLCFVLLVSLNLAPDRGFGQTRADERLAERIDLFLSQALENGFAGAVLVAVDDAVILSEGYGLANREMDIAVTPGTVFNIGSVTKPFTAAATMKLVEEGKLETTDTLGSIFEQAPEDKRDITIHQLLTHTAGISRDAGGFRYDRASRSEFLESFFATPLARNPGGPYEYANAGYTVLAAIIETASGQSYEAFLRTNLLEPAGISKTGYLMPTWQRNEFAHSYYFDVERDDWVDWGITLDRFGDDGVSWNGIGKGDLQSTVLDLYAWHLALKAGKILSRETQILMEERHVPEQPAGLTHYGYGWAIFTSPMNSKIVTHNGSNGYYFADFIRFVDEGVVVIVLTSLDRDERVAWEIVRMAFQADYEPPRFPRNDFELASEFIRTHTPKEVGGLPAYFEERQHSSLTDRRVLNQFGLDRLNKGDLEWAIELFELNTRLFPDDGNLWDSLGEAYLADRQHSSARESFRTALELGAISSDCSWCENSRARLSNLEASTEQP
jgi:CubicO group peptidase (beta-lactamase class C family)